MGRREGSPWRWNDLRLSTRTNLSKLAIAEEVREAELAHTRKGVKKNYDVHDYAAEKHDALVKREKALTGILNPPSPDVTDLAAARAQRAAS